MLRIIYRDEIVVICLLVRPEQKFGILQLYLVVVQMDILADVFDAIKLLIE